MYRLTPVFAARRKYWSKPRSAEEYNHPPNSLVVKLNRAYSNFFLYRADVIDQKSATNTRRRTQGAVLVTLLDTGAMMKQRLTEERLHDCPSTLLELDVCDLLAA